MAAIVPFISLFFLVLISRTFSSTSRESLLTAAVIWGLLLTIITETLSAFRALSYLTILASWVVSGAVLAVLYLSLFRRRRVTSDYMPSLSSLPLSLLLPISFIVFLTGLIAFVAPPNNYDSMTYHLGRVMHWIQNQDVQPYPTNIDRQLFMPPWAEFAITHLYILSGGDRLANAVQWLSMVGSIVGVSLIAKQLAGSRDSQAIASLVALCLPMGILQASSTQNDYVVTFWLVCFVYYVFLMLQVMENSSSFWPQATLAGMSLGLAILTKPTAYLIAPPFLVWLSVALARKLGGRSIRIMLAIGVIAVVINLGHYIRNFEVFGSPIAPSSGTSGVNKVSTITDGGFSPGVIPRLASSLIRNTASEMATPFYYGNRLVEVAVQKLESMLHLKGKHAEFTLMDENTGLPRPIHEDFAGNPVYLLLLILTGAALFCAGNRKGASLRQHYALSLFAGYLLLCFFLKWNIWITRVHLPLFVLSSAVIATTLSEPVFVRARMYAIVLLFITSQYALFFNASRPLIGERSIFAEPRLEQYFRNNHPALLIEYPYAASLLKDRKCNQVGLWLDNLERDSWEYPLWILLKDGNTEGLRIEHVRVSNQSARASLHEEINNFVPCGLVVVEVPERPDQIIENGRTYSKIWMGTKVAVYEAEKDHL